MALRFAAALRLAVNDLCSCIYSSVLDQNVRADMTLPMDIYRLCVGICCDTHAAA